MGHQRIFGEARTAARIACGALGIAAAAFWLRSRVEERWMSEEFGEWYALYKKRSWALLPFIV